MSRSVCVQVHKGFVSLGRLSVKKLQRTLWKQWIWTGELGSIRSTSKRLNSLLKPHSALRKGSATIVSLYNLPLKLTCLHYFNLDHEEKFSEMKNVPTSISHLGLQLCPQIQHIHNQVTLCKMAAKFFDYFSLPFSNLKKIKPVENNNMNNLMRKKKALTDWY